MDNQELIQLLKKVKYDKQAQSELYERLYSNVKLHISIAFGKILGEGEVQEFTQDLFFKLFYTDNCKIDCEKIVNPYAFIFKMADNLVKDSLRRDNKIKFTDDIDVFAANSFDIEKSLLRDEIKYYFTLVDPVSAMLLFKHDYEGYKEKDLAAMYNLSYENVRVKIFRARKKIDKLCNKNKIKYVF